jgi:hypothetical protein
MTDKIITLAIADDTWTEENPRPAPSVLMAENATDRAYLTHSSADWSGVTHEVVGEWEEQTGAPLMPVGLAYQDWIRPFGNDAGVATGELDSMRWQGHAEPKWYDYDDTDPENIQTRRYPVNTMPFTLKITREDHTADPVFPGWGWRVDMLSADPLRDITARGIGIYSDPDWNNYLYTTGAFVDDGSGNYYTECPVGQRTTNPDPVYFALLLGSAKEGTWAMIDTDSEALFWGQDQ